MATFNKRTIFLYDTKTKEKTMEVEAECIGDYAVHPSTIKNNINLTHIPSGLYVHSFSIADTNTATARYNPSTLKKQVKEAAKLCSLLKSVQQPIGSDLVDELKKIVTQARSEKLF